MGTSAESALELDLLIDFEWEKIEWPYGSCYVYGGRTMGEFAVSIFLSSMQKKTLTRRGEKVTGHIFLPSIYSGWSSFSV